MHRSLQAEFSRVRRRILTRHLMAARIVFAILILVILALILFLGIHFAIRATNSQRLVSLGKKFVFPKNELVSISDNKTNILLLGKGGVGHEAPDLTDTMILVSINHQKNTVDLISLPRDIWIPDLRTKLNSVYYWGNKKQSQGGLPLAKSTIEQITNLPIHYAAVIDFSGFKDLINLVGGIDVDVPNSFTDNRFPIPGKENDLCGGDKEFNCRYETITFEKGMKHMDGETALKFVRSRHSEDKTEGTDTARGARQQAVIKALIGKITSRQIITSPKKINEIVDQGFNMMETDLSEDALIALARKGFDSRNSINSHQIPENLLVNPKISPQYDNLYVFVPTSGNWSDLQTWLKQTISH